MDFREAVWKLLPTNNLPALGPNILLHNLEDYYKFCVYVKKNGGNSDTGEHFQVLKNEITKNLISSGYNENGEIVNSSRIHENMTSLFAKACPALILKDKKPFEEGTWGGVMNSDLFFNIWNNPAKVYEICNGNSDAVIIWGAYFYILGIGESSVNFHRNMDIFDNFEQKYFLKAEFLCPNEGWIIDAKNKIQDLRLLYKQEQEAYDEKRQSDISKKILWGMGFAFAGYLIGSFAGVIVGWVPAIIFSKSYDNMIGIFGLIGAAMGFFAGLGHS